MPIRKTRKQIRTAIFKKTAMIKRLQNAITELEREDYLLCDKNQWYTEQVMTFGRGKNKKEVLVGYINWKSQYKCEDGNVLLLDRCKAVRHDGAWIEWTK